MKMTIGSVREIIREELGDQEAADIGLAPSVRHERWQSNRPDIDHLPDAVSLNGKPLFKVGDRIAVEVRTKLLPGEPWLETVVGTVKGIDLATGVVKVADEESDPRVPRIKHFSLTDGLHAFKLVPKRGPISYAPPPEAPASAAEKPSPAAPKATGASKKTYRVYGKKGKAPAHTRLKGQAFLAGKNTKFVPGEQAEVEPAGKKLRVKKVDSDHDQLWEPE